LPAACAKLCVACREHVFREDFCSCRASLLVTTDHESTVDPAAAKAVALIGTATEKRIAWLTLLLGSIAAIATGIFYRRDWAAGLAVGTALAWLNFRWLARGLDALVVDSTAQAGAPKPRVSLLTYFLAAFRYTLIALCVCVIFKVLKVPLLSMLLGLCALGAAAIAASLYELVSPLNSGP
jgi:ATP synthase I chain